MAKKNKFEMAFFVILFLFLFFLIYFLWDNFYIAFTPNKLPEYKEGISVQFKESDLEYLKNLYSERKEEYLFCLMGFKEENVYIINSMKEIKGESTKTNLITKDIECQESENIGTLHKHPKLNFFQRLMYALRNNKPSPQDLYSFGSIRKPLHIIQFNSDKFYANEYFADQFIDSRAIKIESKI